ncbi:MAG TPA: aldose epimerase family protein [Acetobacteraceae bacterium]|nr:aldose epimerase family protein [Acetobacteraceae bacterium]
MTMRYASSLPAVLLSLSLIAGASTMAQAASIQTAPYGTTQDGKAVEIYTMTNDHGLVVKFISYGGVITQIDAPDRTGHMANIVLGLSSLHEYETIPNFFGALVGRYANRIGGARFTLDGHEYHLPANNNGNTLHGGTVGFNKAVWTVTTRRAGNIVSATLTHVSPDGDQGFPGTMHVSVTYTLNDRNELRIDYQATTDKDTVVNFTNHSFFNLAGNGSGSVENQILQIDADRYTPTDATQIPTGELATVAGTPFDFRQPTAIGARLRSGVQQMVYGHGYDHNWVLNGSRRTTTPLPAAHAYDPQSGRTLDVLTTEPGLQVYTSNNFNGTMVGSAGTAYRQTEAFTMETQHFPDSPNKPQFPPTELKPGETFHSTTIFRFSTDAS